MRLAIRAEIGDDNRGLRAFEVMDSRLNGSREELYAILGELGASAVQENIHTEGGRLGLSWPTLNPVTIRIRQHYGHGRGPRLIRGGDLLHSIHVLSTNADASEVGSLLPYASVLDTGGLYEGRNVQAFPYLQLSDQDLDDMMEVALDFFSGEERQPQ